MKINASSLYMGFNLDSLQSIGFYADLFVPNVMQICIALSWYVVATLKT